MANPRYVGLFFADNTGAGLTGLTPAFDTYMDSDGNPITPPSISEAGGGHYFFQPDMDPDLGIFYTVNAGPTAYPQRYAAYIRYEEWNIDNADVPASSIKLKTDNLPASPAAVSDVTSARDAVQTSVTQVYNRIGAPAGSSIAADVAAVLASLSSVSGNVTSIQATLSVIRALVGANAVVDQTTFDGDGNPTADRARFYATDAEATDPDNNTPLATLEYTASWSGPGQLISSTVVLTQGG